MSTLAIEVTTDDEIERIQAVLSGSPERIARARARTFRELSPWLERTVLRTAVSASGIQPQVWQALARFTPYQNADELGIWLGTSRIAAHHLGSVRWSRSMSGAEAGGQRFKGAWAWDETKRTGGLIMRRSTEMRLPIEKVLWDIHGKVLDHVENIAPQINRRYQSVLLRELNREFQEVV